MKTAVLFVCLGNICRSPLAEAAFRAEAGRLGLDVEIDSAGTGDWHRGQPPDRRAIAAARRNGADIAHLKARQVKPDDFRRFDHIVALDAENLADLEAMQPPSGRARLSLLLDHVAGREGEAVADPYYGDDDHFDAAWTRRRRRRARPGPGAGGGTRIMSLILHYHPLASFCWKVLIALYENDIAFAPKLVDLGDPESRGDFAALWPIAKMPVLEDEGRGAVVPETSIIIDYLDRHHPGPVRFVPEDPDRAREARLWDRIFDAYVQAPMQKIVIDRIRPDGQRDPFGVEEARTLLATAMAMVDRDLGGRTWVTGEDFSLADCAAAPALFYADKVMPLAGAYPNALALLERLRARPSFARVLAEAEPYFQYFPAG